MMLFVDGHREGSGEGAPMSGRGLQPDQTLGREGEVPAAACVPVLNSCSLKLHLPSW